MPCLRACAWFRPVHSGGTRSGGTDLAASSSIQPWVEKFQCRKLILGAGSTEDKSLQQDEGKPGGSVSERQVEIGWS